MKQCRELISMLLVMAILTMSLPMTVVAEEMPVAETLPVAELALPESRSGAVVNQGTCGDSLTWTLDDAGTLTISGTGPMEDYSWDWESPAPWYSVRETIKKVKIGSGDGSVDNKDLTRLFQYMSDWDVEIY